MTRTKNGITKMASLLLLAAFYCGTMEKSLASESKDVQTLLQAGEGEACQSAALRLEGVDWGKLADFTRQAEIAIHSANVLNHYFMSATNITQVDSLLLLSLVRANVETDPLLWASAIAVDGHSVSAERGLDNRVRVRDHGPLNHGPAHSWYWTLTVRDYLLNDSEPVTKVFDGQWFSPFIDCNSSADWQISFGAPFFAFIHERLKFRGAVSVSIPITDIDINQCDGDSLFAATHHCDIASTQCVPVAGRGFRGGAYRCYCKPDFHPEEEGAPPFVEGVDAATFRCVPCPRGCILEYSVSLRSLVLATQSFCSTLVVVLAVVVFLLRKQQIFASSMWVMLEAILIGSLFLYQTVVIRYFEPSVLTCMVEPWLRGMGFATCYGAIILKIYRILAEFQTRKAHRVCVRDKDLLKYLLAMVAGVVAYLLAWTALLLDSALPLIVHLHSPQGLKYTLCRALWADYVTELGELFFLLFGVFLTYKTRNARSDIFHEKEMLAWSLYIEALMSLLMYTIRHVVWSNLQPDYIYLLYFLRCQCTVTVILLFIFAPKLWYHARPPSESVSGDQLHETVKEIDLVDSTLADMDTEDIRAELRRLYTEIHQFRCAKAMKNNPHIPKRRRKGTYRRFSLQTFHHRHKHNGDASKTPSTASLEDVTCSK